MINNKDPFKIPIKSTPGGLLAVFWRNILNRTNRTERRLSLITNAILEEKLKSDFEDNVANGLKHRLKKQCDDGDMTWRTLLRLCCLVLKVQNFKITFQFEIDGEEYIVSQDIVPTNNLSLIDKEKEKND